MFEGKVYNLTKYAKDHIEECTKYVDNTGIECSSIYSN
jgi:hypothetical protein